MGGSMPPRNGKEDEEGRASFLTCCFHASSASSSSVVVSSFGALSWERVGRDGRAGTVSWAGWSQQIHRFLPL